MKTNYNVNRRNYTETMWEIIESKNIEEAKRHYDACTSQSAKDIWWNVIEQIWRNTAKANHKICRKWHVDRIHKMVVPRIEGVDSGNYVYWIRLIDADGNVRFDKFGSAEDLVRRWGTLFESKFIGEYNITNYRVMRTWDCGDAPFMNEEMEAHLKRMAVLYYGKEHYVPNDRFDCRLSPKLVDKWATEFLAANGVD